MNLPVRCALILRPERERRIGCNYMTTSSITVSFAAFLAESPLVVEHLCLEFVPGLLGRNVLLVVWLQGFPFDLPEWYIVLLI